MNCCCNCFVDSALIQIIISNSKLKGTCDFCGSVATDLVNCNQLSIYFESLFELYTPHPDANGSLKINSPFLIHEHITAYWPQLFNHEFLEGKIIKFLVDNIAKGSDVYNEINF
jgi:hypothetical protein